ncbi:hypothetical protein OT109_00220 [Phycisphaeraceae bacterium D3-23]
MTSATLQNLEQPAAALTPTPLVQPGQPALAPAHLAQLDDARVRRKKIGRALFTAGMSAWTLAVFAALSLPFALFDLKSGLVGIALGFIAYREFAGRHKLKQLAPEAASHLGWNQVLLCGLLAVYATWQIIHTLTGPSPYAEAIATTPELAPTLEPIEEMMRLAALAVYGSILVVGLLTQGLLALYYFTRRSHICTYLDQTPAWIVELQRRG